MAAPSLDDAFTQRRLARARRHPLGTLNETRAWIACDGCGAESLTSKAWTDVVQEVIDEADLLTTSGRKPARSSNPRAPRAAPAPRSSGNGFTYGRATAISSSMFATVAPSCGG